MGEEIIARLVNVNKHFAGIYALNDVSIDIKKGEVLAIIGENGAGKSTLMKILAGIYTPTSGNVILEGKNINHLNIKQRQNAGIAMVHQEIVDFFNLSVAGNIYAGIEPRTRGFVNKKEMVDDAKAIIDELETDLDPNAIVGTLNAAKRQMTMIAKALAYNSKLIIMDEPNSALTDEESLNLFRIINKLKVKGISILYISHRLEEVLSITDRIVVMRDGTYVTSMMTKEATVDDMIRHMVGRELNNVFPIREKTGLEAADEVLLDVKNIFYKNILQNVTFQLRSGEILGIAGLEGSGRTEIAEALVGAIKANTNIEMRGERYSPRTPRFAFEQGIAYVPPERRLDSILPQRSVKHNMAISNLKRLKSKGLVSDKKINQLANSYVGKIKIKTSSIDQSILDLSGGNQQKAIIARSLATNPRIVIFNEPTRGIDVGAKYEIYKLMHELANQGLGIIFISSEMQEILGMSERIMAVKDGRVTGMFSAQEATNEKVLSAMMDEKTNIA